MIKPTTNRFIEQQIGNISGMIQEHFNGITFAEEANQYKGKYQISFNVNNIGNDIIDEKIAHLPEKQKEIVKKNIIKDVKDILKYGAANLNEQEARNISEAEEKKRRIEAYMRMQIKRAYQDMARKKGITESKLIQLCAAGNCGEHAKLVYDKLLESCPSTIKIELRVVQLGEDDNHAYVAIKPSNVSDDSQTIILDAWPSNQINNPHVVDSKNHFTDHAGEYEVCDEGNGKLSSQGDGKSWDEINITQNNYKNKRPEPINTNTVKKIYKENISSTTPTTPTGYDNSSPTLH